MSADDPFDIPEFLIRPQPEEPSMTPTAKDQQAKKKRTITQLPTTLSDGSVIADLTFDELVEKRATWEKAVADHEQEELELRAIRGAIRRKA
jgi:hypothetical protein